MKAHSSNLSLTSGLDGGGWLTHRSGRFTPRKKPGTHLTGDWVGPGPVWTHAEILASTGIRSPDRPAGSETLSRLAKEQRKYHYNA
jgi:hypothetical protein